MNKQFTPVRGATARNIRTGVTLSVGILMSLSLIGCTSAPEPVATTDAGPKATGLLAEIQDRGYITVGTTGDNRPTIFKEGDKLVGLDADWADIIAKELNVDVRWEIVQFSALVPGLEAGKFDIAMSGINVTDARKEVINFSTPYAQDAVVAVFPKGGTISVDDTPEEALKGRSVCVVAGSANGDAPATALGTFSDIQRYTGGIAVIMQALKDGRCDMAMTTRIAVDTYIKTEGSDLARTKAAINSIPIGVGIPKQDSEDLVAAIDAAMTAAKKSGDCQKLAVKWVGTEFPAEVCS